MTAGLLWLAPSAAMAEDVDVALVIAMDISASVNAEEYRAQIAGLAAALRDPAVAKAVQSGPNAKVALSVMLWSGAKAQYLVLPWTLLTDDTDLVQVSGLVRTIQRPDEGGATSISAAIRNGIDLLAQVPTAKRKVIDVSADGISNIGPSLESAREAAAQLGITINGLAITNEWRALRNYLENHVIAGPDSFAVEARTYSDYGEVMLRKLLREIQKPGLV
jgi:hypothetical protein